MQDMPNHPYYHHDPSGHDPAEPGLFEQRDAPHVRDYRQRAFTVGIGGPVGSGKTALLLALCRRLRDRYSLAVVYERHLQKEDGAFLCARALETRRITAVETGRCPAHRGPRRRRQNLDAPAQLDGEVEPEFCVRESAGQPAAQSAATGRFTLVIDVSAATISPAGGAGHHHVDLP